MVSYPFITKTSDGVILDLIIQPNASKTIIAGEYSSCLKIRISSPPIEGKANAQLKTFLSKTFNLSKSRLEFLSGEQSRKKRVLLKSARIDLITQRLVELL